jgi:predicted MPP superfamily phosphohydrolase
MRSSFGLFIFLLIVLLVDLYVLQAIKLMVQNASDKTRLLVFSLYGCLTFFSVTVILLFAFSSTDFLGKSLKTFLFSIVLGLFIAKLIMVLFFMIDDLRRLIQWILLKINFLFKASYKMDDAVNVVTTDDNITRSLFMSWLGVSTGTLLFGSLLSGFSNKYNYKLIKQKLTFPNLPNAFKGLKIIHISDIHSGSLSDKEAVKKGIDIINSQQADLILFTGDLVNDRASEMNDLKDLFAQLKAPLGVYSSLGNHDYGEYVQWPDKDGITKEENLDRLKNIHADMGWKLLLNEHVLLQKGDDKLALIGVENWSAKARFPKYGKLDKAYEGLKDDDFKILMSHDPSHWHAEVLKDYGNVHLTLSGHTHGMQFGVELPGFKWSPVQYVYNEWAGLYENGHQKLYVNRGFGFLGYPGRVGIMPEITLLELA